MAEADPGNDDGLTDSDVLAVLVREPFSGVTPALYASLSDRQVLGVYFAPRDDDGSLIPEARRRGKGGKDTGHTRDAPHELPSAESLAVPDAAFACRDHAGRGVPVAFVLAWWQCWRSRDTETTEQLLARWGREMAAYGMYHHGADQPPEAA